MTSVTPVSKFAHLYLGDPARGDPAPVFRDLSPDGVRATNGTLVAWPDDAVLALYFDGGLWPQLREGRQEDLDVWEFFERDGWPLGFPSDCRVDVRSFRREFQVFPYGWRHWRRDTLERTARDERSRPGVFGFHRAQAGLARRVVPRLPAPRVTP